MKALDHRCPCGNADTVAVIVLARRNSAWGFGAGFAIAIVWNGLSLFVTHLMQAGAVAFWSSLRTGHVEQLVPMMVALRERAQFDFMPLSELPDAIPQVARWWCDEWGLQIGRASCRERGGGAGCGE